jgi:hypothetical protein
MQELDEDMVVLSKKETGINGNIFIPYKRKNITPFIIKGDFKNKQEYEVPSKGQKRIDKWINKNKEKLLKYWNNYNTYDSFQLVKDLEKL